MCQHHSATFIDNNMSKIISVNSIIGLESLRTGTVLDDTEVCHNSEGMTPDTLEVKEMFPHEITQILKMYYCI